MDSEKLKSLRIRREARRRSRGPRRFILGLILLVTAAGAGFASPRKEDERRLRGGMDPALRTEETNRAADPTIAAAVGTGGDVVLTVGGCTVIRERIELSPRFTGELKWTGVRPGDTVTNGQVAVLLDDAERRARVKEAGGRVANARAALEKAELEGN